MQFSPSIVIVCYWQNPVLGVWKYFNLYGFHIFFFSKDVYNLYTLTCCFIYGCCCSSVCLILSACILIAKLNHCSLNCPKPFCSKCEVDYYYSLSPHLEFLYSTCHSLVFLKMFLFICLLGYHLSAPQK